MIKEFLIHQEEGDYKMNQTPAPVYDIGWDIDKSFTRELIP